tara:strand:+ start:33679 stop:34677 length:999 start_codon:yes stop_codon:yes gene_type:complete
MKYNYAVVGAGAWGTALANMLAKINNEKIIIWAKETKVVNQINNERQNNIFLPHVNLEKNIEATEDINKLVAPYIFYATPSQHFESILISHKKVINDNSQIIICSKGIEMKNGSLLGDIYEKVLSNNNYLILSGPSFANEVAKSLPAALILASKDIKKSIKLAKIISSRNFRLYLSEDVIGTQLGGAIKNIYAIGAGIVKGLNYGENARAAFLTRSIAEMVKICIVLGGKKESIFGLSGVGDVFLTCNSETSRNFVLGRSIGEGLELKNILSNNKTVAEGYFTTKALHFLLKSRKIDTPIMLGIYNILYKGLSIKTVVDSLLNRPLKTNEFD